MAWPRRDVLSFAGVFGLLGAVYLLPPDTSLQQVRAAGVLRACLPPSYPPLVTGDPAAPGIDVALLAAIASDIGVRLVTVSNPAMGRDFNPRAWRLTRAQCDILGGAIAGTATTRSFLDITPAYAETGWARVAPSDAAVLAGQRIAVLAGTSGLDRIALASWLRAAKAQVVIVPDSTALVAGLKDGRFDAGITERLTAADITARAGLTIGWMPPELARTTLVFGLWKGDLTLKRAIVSAMRRLDQSGTIRGILARYQVKSED